MGNNRQSHRPSDPEKSPQSASSSPDLSIVSPSDNSTKMRLTACFNPHRDTFADSHSTKATSGNFSGSFDSENSSHNSTNAHPYKAIVPHHHSGFSSSLTNQSESLGSSKRKETDDSHQLSANSSALSKKARPVTAAAARHLMIAASPPAYNGYTTTFVATNLVPSGASSAVRTNRPLQRPVTASACRNILPAASTKASPTVSAQNPVAVTVPLSSGTSTSGASFLYIPAQNPISVISTATPVYRIVANAVTTSPALPTALATTSNQSSPAAGESSFLSKMRTFAEVFGSLESIGLKDPVSGEVRHLTLQSPGALELESGRGAVGKRVGGSSQAEMRADSLRSTQTDSAEAKLKELRTELAAEKAKQHDMEQKLGENVAAKLLLEQKYEASKKTSVEWENRVKQCGTVRVELEKRLKDANVTKADLQKKLNDQKADYEHRLSNLSKEKEESSERINELSVEVGLLQTKLNDSEFKLRHSEWKQRDLEKKLKEAESQLSYMDQKLKAADSTSVAASRRIALKLVTSKEEKEQKLLEEIERLKESNKELEDDLVIVRSQLEKVQRTSVVVVNGDRLGKLARSKSHGEGKSSAGLPSVMETVLLDGTDYSPESSGSRVEEDEASWLNVSLSDQPVEREPSGDETEAGNTEIVTPPDLQPHARKPRHKAQTIQCPKCNMSMRKNKAYKKHIASCRPTLFCPTCNMGFKRQRGLSAHMAHCCQVVGLRCPTCNLELKNAARYERHVKQCRASLHCPTCDRAFEKPKKLRRHIREDHQPPREPPKAFFVCAYCTLRSNHESFVKEHESTCEFRHQVVEP